VKGRKWREEMGGETRRGENGKREGIGREAKRREGRGMEEGKGRGGKERKRRGDG